MNLNRNKLEKILLADDIYNSLLENEELLFKIISELKYEKGFDQKNKYHCYDVWNHTLNVIKNSKCDLEIRLILLLHDIGKPFSYQDDNDVRHFKGHALKSAEMAQSILKDLEYDKDFIERICFFIKNHATPIEENDINIDISKYEKLLYIQYCDASGYDEEYSFKTKKRLNLIKNKIEEKKNKY